MPIEAGERLTLNEMIEKYPDQWLLLLILKSIVTLQNLYQA